MNINQISETRSKHWITHRTNFRSFCTSNGAIVHNKLPIILKNNKEQEQNRQKKTEHKSRKIHHWRKQDNYTKTPRPPSSVNLWWFTYDTWPRNKLQSLSAMTENCTMTNVTIYNYSDKCDTGYHQMIHDEFHREAQAT